MNSFQKLARKIIKKAFDLSVKTIERFSHMEPYHKKVADLRTLERGTLGNEIAQCLDAHRLSLVPKYESHDLKHVLLDYKMTAEDEIRLQAFMIGNGNYSVVSFAIFSFGALLLPDLWSTFAKDFKKGRQTIPISRWTIESHKNHALDALRLEIQKPIKTLENAQTMNRFTYFAALTALFAGVFGMIFCLPYLFSSNLADLVGAGFPFLAGAILAVGGLLALSNLSKQKPNQQALPTMNPEFLN